MKQLLLCYICGREFGTASLAIHEPQCIEKFHARQESVPKSQRQPLPTKPEAFKETQQAQGFNQQKRDVYNEQAREGVLAARAECEFCHRKFDPDRLVIHSRSCGPGSHFVKEMEKRIVKMEGLPAIALAHKIQASVPLLKKSSGNVVSVPIVGNENMSLVHRDSGTGQSSKTTSVNLPEFVKMAVTTPTENARLKSAKDINVKSPTSAKPIAISPSKNKEDKEVKNNKPEHIALNNENSSMPDQVSFCTECGSKFGTGAKFCGSCGVRRTQLEKSQQSLI